MPKQSKTTLHANNPYIRSINILQFHGVSSTGSKMPDSSKKNRLLMEEILHHLGCIEPCE